MAIPPRLSLILPVYNVAAYLPACLDSLLAQTFIPDEIIAVDDGSTDACPQILADYRPRLPGLKVIRQTNGGLSAARNTGLAAATGRWLAFLDSDDFVDPELYARQLAIAEADDLDMLLCNARYHFEGRQADYAIYADEDSAAPLSPITSGADWMKRRLQESRLLHMVWMHLYRRDFVERNRYRFVPPFIHEDVIWTTRALLAARRVRYDSRPGHCYRIPIRTYTPEQNERRVDLLVRSSVFNARGLAELVDGAVTDPELADMLRFELVDGGFSVFHKLKKLPPASRRTHYRKLRRDGYFAFLWSQARGLTQKRRIARNYLLSLF